MNAQEFGVMRNAIRAAKAAGWSYVRIEREINPRAPDNAAYVDKWFFPYLRSRVADQYSADLYSYAITDTEKRVFGITTENYAHTEADTLTLTRYEIEAQDCERCEDRIWSDNARLVYTEGRRSDYAEQYWCESCAAAHSTVWESESYDDDLMVTLVDTGRAVPHPYAQDNCYWDDGNSEWRQYAPDYESDDEDSDRDNLDDDGTLFRYATNVLFQHSWPSNAPHDGLVFGVELEVQSKDFSSDGVRTIAQALGGRKGKNNAYILAADGSLDPDEHTSGLEIITVPQTLEGHRTGAVIPWREISKALASSNAISGQGTNACGMHVHINRRALSQLQVGKMMVFINSPKTQQLVELIAQRPATQFCVRKPKTISDVFRAEENHYDALNVGTEHGTLELRIFKGNTRHSRILKNLEFAHALCLYCRDCSMLDAENPDAFRAYIFQRCGQYPNLCKFLSERTEDETQETAKCA